MRRQNWIIALMFALVVTGVSCNKGVPDTTPLSITDVSASNITMTGATIIWTTDQEATSQVEYAVAIDYGSSTALDKQLVTSHFVGLNGLTPGTTYHFRVKSKDASENEATSEDHTFATLTSTSVGGITVNFTGSTYASVTEKPTGWFETGQDADIVLN